MMETLKITPKPSLTILHTQTPVKPTIPRFTVIYALRKGYLNLIRHLLYTGSNANSIEIKDLTKRTPLIYCTFIKDANWALSVAQNLLEKGANLIKSDNKSLNALHYCCAFDKNLLLDLFLNSLDFDLLTKVDLNGNTCLHYATAYRNLKCIRLILNKCKQYNLKTIEYENNFGYKPTDMLNLNTNQFNNREIDDKCKLILRNYDRNLLATRQSFDNIANILPMNELRILSDKIAKTRPITAPVALKIDENSDNNMDVCFKKHKISFNVIPPSPSSSSANSLACARPLSTQSHKLFKLNSKNNENLLKKIDVESTTAVQKVKTGSSNKNQCVDNQLLIDLNEISINSISFNNLFIDKEHIVNPNGINTVVVTNSYHTHHQNQQQMSITSFRDDKILNNRQLKRTMSATKQFTLLDIQLAEAIKNSQQNQQVSKTMNSQQKLLRSPSVTIASGRQSRQSFFNGYLVTSQSGKIIFFI
jgi:hypothetical protein